MSAGHKPALIGPGVLRRFLEASTLPALIIAAAAIAAAARAGYVWIVLGPELEPDTSAYLDGAGLYPSPLGTILGELGLEALAAANLAAAAGLILVSAALAGWHGPRAAIAAAAAFLLPVSFWAVYATTDALAALAIAAAVLVYRSSSPASSHAAPALLCFLACGLHLAAVPVVAALVLGLRRDRAIAAAVVLICTAGALGSLTPYAPALELPSLHGLLVGLVGLLAGIGPALLALLVARDGALLLACAGAVLAGSLVGSVGHNGGSRYSLPLLPLAAATLGRAAPVPVAPRAPVPARLQKEETL